MISNVFSAAGRTIVAAARATWRTLGACIVAIRSLGRCCCPQTNDSPPSFDLDRERDTESVVVHNIEQNNLGLLPEVQIEEEISISPVAPDSPNLVVNPSPTPENAENQAEEQTEEGDVSASPTLPTSPSALAGPSPTFYDIQPGDIEEQSASRRTSLGSASLNLSQVDYDWDGNSSDGDKFSILQISPSNLSPIPNKTEDDSNDQTTELSDSSELMEDDFTDMSLDIGLSLDGYADDEISSPPLPLPSSPFFSTAEQRRMSTSSRVSLIYEEPFHLESNGSDTDSLNAHAAAASLNKITEVQPSAPDSPGLASITSYDAFIDSSDSEDERPRARTPIHFIPTTQLFSIEEESSDLYPVHHVVHHAVHPHPGDEKSDEEELTNQDSSTC